MQVIFEDENKRSVSRRANLIDLIICIGKISRYIEREFIRRLRI